MVLTEQDIRKMVESTLMEVRHRLDRRMRALAVRIAELGQQGGGEIPAAEVNAMNPYFRTDKNLTVKVLKVSEVQGEAYFNRGDMIIALTPQTLKNKRLVSIIIHELSHYIDIGKRTKLDTDNLSHGNDRLNNCTYLFLPTEMQARLAQYGELIENSLWHRRLKITNPNTGLFIEEMEGYLNRIKSAHYSTYNYTFGLILVLWVFIHESAKRVMRRHGTDEFSDIQNHVLNYFPNQQAFEKAKAAIVKLYEKRLNAFKHKALKIKYDVIQSNYEPNQ